MVLYVADEVPTLDDVLLTYSLTVLAFGLSFKRQKKGGAKLTPGFKRLPVDYNIETVYFHKPRREMA